MPTFEVGTGKSGSGGYETLADWQTARATAVRTGPEIAQVFDNQTGISLSGWTNIDSTNYIEIVGQTTMDGTKATGVLISRSADNSGALAIGTGVTHLNLRNLRFHNSGATNAHGLADFGFEVLTLVVENCIAYDCLGSAYYFEATDASSSITFKNSMALGSARGFDANTGLNVPNVESCLAYGNSYGILNCLAKNSISVGNTTDNFFGDSASSDYNISGNTSGNGANTKKSVTATASLTPGAGTWVGFTNISSGTEDFNLIDFSDASTNWAIDQVASGTAPSTDMTGAARDATPDRGPLELAGGGGGGSFQFAWARYSTITLGGANR